MHKTDFRGVVLVQAVIRDYKVHEMGDTIKFGAKHIDVVGGVNFQPVSFTRIAHAARAKGSYRTLSFVVKEEEICQ